MTRYLLGVVEPAGEPPPPDELQKIVRDITAVRDEMQHAEVWVFSGGLHPPSAATVVRVEDGEVLTSDGPFAEAKEHLGGFTIIDVPDLETALGWARKTAEATTLPIEVRPFR